MARVLRVLSPLFEGRTHCPRKPSSFQGPFVYPAHLQMSLVILFFPKALKSPPANMARALATGLGTLPSEVAWRR